MTNKQFLGGFYKTLFSIATCARGCSICEAVLKRSGRMSVSEVRNTRPPLAAVAPNYL